MRSTQHAMRAGACTGKGEKESTVRNAWHALRAGACTGKGEKESTLCATHGMH